MYRGDKMNREQTSQFQELLRNLSGDIVALSAFCRCQEECTSDYGTEAAYTCARRIQSAIYSDVSQIIGLTDQITDDALPVLQGQGRHHEPPEPSP